MLTFRFFPLLSAHHSSHFLVSVRTGRMREKTNFIIIIAIEWGKVPCTNLRPSDLADYGGFQQGKEQTAHRKNIDCASFTKQRQKEWVKKNFMNKIEIFILDKFKFVQEVGTAQHGRNKAIISCRWNYGRKKHTGINDGFTPVLYLHRKLQVYAMAALRITFNWNHHHSCSDKVIANYICIANSSFFHPTKPQQIT